MTSANSRRIYGALVGMAAAAVPSLLLVLVLGGSRSRAGSFREHAFGLVLFVALPAISGLVSGATLGAKIADRRLETGRTALLRGVGMALWASVIFHALVAAYIVVLWIIQLGQNVVAGNLSTTSASQVFGFGTMYFMLMLLVTVPWTLFVGIPMGTVAGLVLHAIGGELAAADAGSAARLGEARSRRPPWSR